MKRKFTFLIAAAFMLLTMMASTGEMWGQTRNVQELTNANIVAAGDPDGGYKDWTITDNNDNEWNAYAIKNKHSNATSAYHYLQIKKYASNTAYYIQLPELGTKITSITMTVSGSNQPMTGGGNNATLFFSNSNSTSSSGSGVVSGTGASSVTIDCTSLNLNTGYITSSGAVRIWDISVSYTSGGGTTPSISAYDVQMGCNAQGTSIHYEIGNYVAGTMTAATEATWITDLDDNPDPIEPNMGSIEVTTTINESVSPRSATVTLTYTYNTDQTVTKDVTVTQSGNPNASGGANNPYSVAQAIAAIDAGTGVTDVYASGIVCKIDSYNSTYHSITYWISDDGTTATKLEAYSGKGINGADFASIDDIKIGASVVIKGNLKKYNSTYEFDLNNQLVSYVAPVIPIISVTPTSVNASNEDTDGVLTVTHENITTFAPEVWFCNAEGTAAETYTWVTADVNTDDNVDYIIEANNGAARTAYLKVHALDDDLNDVYSNLVTINQAAPDYATLPFEYEGGVLADFSGLTGTSYYLKDAGSYAEGNAPYRIKFTQTGDYLQVKTDSQPGIVTIGVKVFNAGNDSKITVQGSADGNNFSDIQELTISASAAGTSSLETTASFSENHRYVRLLFTRGVNVGVGPISITQVMEKVATPEFSPVGGTYHSAQNVTITCATDGATIYYTTDGSNPTTGSTEYTGGIPVSVSKTIKAIAVKDGMVNSDIATAVYNIPTITVSPTLVEVDGNENDGVIDVTYTLIESDPEIVWYSDELATVTITEPDWISTGFDASNNIEYIIEANTGSARTAYLKVYGLDGEANDVYSELITINQGVLIITGTINFGNADGSTNINAASVSGDDTMGNTWTITTDGTTSFTPKQEYAQVGSSSKPATSITFTTTLAESTTIADFQAKFGGFSDTEGEITLKVGSTTVGTGSLNATNDVLVVNSTQSTGTTLTVTVTDIAKGVKCYYISYTKLTYDIYGSTEITNLTIPVGETLAIHSGAVLEITETMTNNGDASNLIIEDGGQLVLPENATVQATVKKAVGHAAKSTGDWYTISSPVNNIAPGDVTNLIQATPENYDLYYYDEATTTWFNHKAAGHAVSNMTNGRGYLYWNAGGDELAFAGELNTGEVEVAVTAGGSDDLAGINLIGNPYSNNIYKGDGTAIPNAGASLVTGFYVLSNSDSWVACTDNTTAIKPGQGILVKTTTGGTVQMTNTTSKGTAKAGNDNIRFTVANNQYEDVAYALFKNEIGLDKINHRNAEVPMLYIPQDGINYAIATMSDDVEMFTLSFKTVTTSKYTLSVKLDGRYDYLHIIDRLTGEDVDMLVEGEYSFMGTPKDLVDRFIVKLKYDANINDVNDIFAYQSGSDVIVNGEGELQIFDLMGRKVMTQTVNGVQTVNVPAQGVYIFRLNGKVQKIVVK